MLHYIGEESKNAQQLNCPTIVLDKQPVRNIPANNARGTKSRRDRPSTVDGSYAWKLGHPVDDSRRRRRRRRVDVRAQAVASMPASNIRSSF